MRNTQQPIHLWTRPYKIMTFILIMVIFAITAGAIVDKYMKDKRALETQQVNELTWNPEQLPKTWAEMMSLKEKEGLNGERWQKVTFVWLVERQDEYVSTKRSLTNFYSDYSGDERLSMRQDIKSAAKNYNEGAKTMDPAALGAYLPSSLDEDPVIDP